VSAGLWYAAGLRFRCRRCGACCTGAPGYVWLQAEEAAAIAARLGIEPEEFLSRHTRRVYGLLSLREDPDGRCVLFESGRGCRAYEARPRQCRTWPFWARNVATRAAWDREAVECPGMGSGDLFGPDEIERCSGPPDRPGHETGGA
jgi:hypothetical protein